MSIITPKFVIIGCIVTGFLLQLISTRFFSSDKHPGINWKPKNWFNPDYIIWNTQDWFTGPGYSLNVIGLFLILFGAIIAGVGIIYGL